MTTDKQRLAEARELLELVTERLRYYPSTGRFVWRPRNSFRYSGMEAGHLSPIHGYRFIRIDGELYHAHRLAWFYIHGYMPQEIDHINHDRSDNRLKNLREVTRDENRKNLAISDRNKSGVTGVVWCRQTGKWRAQIVHKRQHYHLGRFTSFVSAVRARRTAEQKLNFHRNHGR